MKNVVVDALRKGSYTSTMPAFPHKLYEPWTCPECGATYELFATGNYPYPPEIPGDVDSSVRVLDAALRAGCNDGHRAMHLRSTNGEAAVVLF